MKLGQDRREVLCKRTCFNKAVPFEEALPHLEQLDRVPRPNQILILVCHVPRRLCKEDHHTVGCHTQSTRALRTPSLLLRWIAGKASNLCKLSP